MSSDNGEVRQYLDSSIDPILAPIIRKLVIAQPKGAQEIRRAIAEIALGSDTSDPMVAAAAQNKSANVAAMSGVLPRPATAVGEVSGPQASASIRVLTCGAKFSEVPAYHYRQRLLQVGPLPKGCNRNSSLQEHCADGECQGCVAHEW